jgi:hypothetical protein
MAQPNSMAKEISSSHSDRRIRVLIAEGKGFSSTTFSEAEIKRIVEIAGPRHHPWQQGRGEDRAIQERRGG